MVREQALMRAAPVSEKLFQEAVLSLAKVNGWKAFHPLSVRDFKGNYRTALAGDKGFPDLVLARKPSAQRVGGLIFAELKAESGRIAIEQIEWSEHLAPWGEWYLWRPRDMDSIIERLSRRPS
jgi:hypothetical protein